MKKLSKIFRRLLLLALLIFLAGLLVPQSFQVPVAGAGKRDYNPDSFWYHPWGRSGAHRGVDIFAKAGTPVHPATPGFVLATGQNSMGGNIVLMLGPKWRLHYYAHLQTIEAKSFTFVGHKDWIGAVGATGNAAGKPSHLHYSIMTPIPYPWLADNDKLGLLKMFYLNPVKLLDKA